MSQSISKKWARSVSIIICSLWLGLSGVLAQTDPAFLVQRGITDTVHSELLGEDRLIYVDFHWDTTLRVQGNIRLPFCSTAMYY
jgi:hypothetical protein